MQRACSSFAIALVFLFASIALAGPVGTAFTYQGSLNSAGAPYTGSADFQFKLYTASAAGTQVGPTLNALATPVANGAITVTLDFGAAAFTTDAERWLETLVRAPAGAGAYTTLTPRQRLNATPFSLYSLAPWATSAAGELSFQNNVGIGLTDPAVKLHVNGGMRLGGATGYVLASGITNSHDITLDFYRQTGPFNGTIWFHSSGSLIDDSEIQFWTKHAADADQSERMVIAPDGKVGINVFPPLEMLHVGGNLRVDGTISHAPRTNYANFSAGSFIELFGSVGQSRRTYTRISNLAQPAFRIVNLVADANLPDGALLNEVQITWGDVGAGNASLVIHVDPAVGGHYLDWTSPGTYSSSPQVTTLPIGPFTIDNSAGPTRIEVYLYTDAGSPDSAAWLDRVRLRHTVAD